MNKQELNAKWSKYCNTDKLVDDTMKLLFDYGHANTEHGVCTLLDKYFTNKEPLIKMFAASKHYAGNMRIISEAEFERVISPREVEYFLNVPNVFNANNLLKYKDDKDKTFFDYLPIGKKVFNVDELPSENQQKVKISLLRQFDLNNFATAESIGKYNEFKAYMRYFSRIYTPTISSSYCMRIGTTPELKAGTKTSRALNKVCAFYGVDKFPDYNKTFAQYSDLVSNLKRNMQFVISLNPLDYLMMSNGINWVSCHNIRSGSYMGGTLSYMLDTTSIITFVVDKIDDDIHKIPRVYRQMYHYEKNLFIQNRLYPQGNDGATNLYDRFRKIVIDEFSDLLGVEGEWKHSVGPSECTAHAVNAPGSKHYPDHTYNKNASIFYPANNEPSVMRHKMTIGHPGICVNCGKEYSGNGRLNHAYASDCRR